jgi:hypothetical protein
MSLKIEGLNEMSVVVEGSNIRIIKKGRLFAAQREKTLPIRNISSVEVKKPGIFWYGFIQFSIAGGKSRNSSSTLSGGSYDAGRDENSVCFHEDSNFNIAIQIKQYIESELATPVATYQVSSFSSADEIIKLKSLLDSGILSQDEFDAKKKQILGL